MNLTFAGSAKMDTLNESLEGLYEKLDTLQITLQMLPDQMILALRSQGTPSPAQIPNKDVLPEETEMTSRTPSANGRVLSPEAQIQRLTAQLTAAYNRIAALEEQLMARRTSY
jgi:chromosome segregation ATPase